MHDLVRAERSGHAHIGFVTEDIVGPRQLCLDRRHHELCGSRPQANHCQATAGATDEQGIDGVIGDQNRQAFTHRLRRQQLR
ncbi:hypothetical protein D3C77_448870 [compost metagenome]